jgi:hypothetical protein
VRQQTIIPGRNIAKVALDAIIEGVGVAFSTMPGSAPTCWKYELNIFNIIFIKRGFRFCRILRTVPRAPPDAAFPTPHPECRILNAAF